MGFAGWEASSVREGVGDQEEAVAGLEGRLVWMVIAGDGCRTGMSEAQASSD